MVVDKVIKNYMVNVYQNKKHEYENMNIRKIR